MPCIIDPNHPQSIASGSIWGAYCGKTVWFNNDPFRTADEALKSGKPICRQCRKAAGLPEKEKTTSDSQELPFTLYRVSCAEINTYTIVKETKTGYRTQKGELLQKSQRIGGGIWKLVGGEAAKVVATRDRDEAIEIAAKQAQALKEYGETVVRNANELLAETKWR